MDIPQYNRGAWDHYVDIGDQWTIPVGAETIARARRGDWSLLLTPTVPVPRAWFGPLEGCKILCLASGGGQQGPVLAAAGAQVTVFDNSDKQLGQDRMVAERDGLALETVHGDMRDLSAFAAASFDLIFHPVSNCFVEDVRPVWRECHRVLASGGALLAGFTNPLLFCFDNEARERGELVVRHRIPYSDVTSISEAERRRWVDNNEPLEFGHTLADQIGGQLDAGFQLTAMYEDVEHLDEAKRTISNYIPTFIATRAVKP